VRFTYFQIHHRALTAKSITRNGVSDRPQPDPRTQARMKSLRCLNIRFHGKSSLDHAEWLACSIASFLHIRKWLCCIYYRMIWSNSLLLYVVRTGCIVRRPNTVSQFVWWRAPPNCHLASSFQALQASKQIKAAFGDGNATCTY
jgi:hypothetical protein